MLQRITIVLALGLVLGADVRRPAARRQDAPLAHPHDPVLQTEHVALLDLISPADATHTALQDGLWSEAATWKNGQKPAAQATVLIPKGKTVTLDQVLSTPLRAVRVDGTLQFAPDKNTGLVVDTLLVAPAGRLIIGTAENPIAAGKRAEIRITGRGPIDTEWDPTLLSRGLLSHGTVTIHGAPITPYLALARPARRGDTKLLLAHRPTNWKKGDLLVLTGTVPSAAKEAKGGATDGKGSDMPFKKPYQKNSGGKGYQNERQQKPLKPYAKPPERTAAKGAAAKIYATNQNQDEELTVLAIAGTEVTVAPLTYDHSAPQPDLAIYVANLTRNVVIKSASPQPVQQRGHAMFMHSPKVDLAFAGFYDLGRTNKREPIDDPVVDNQNHLKAGTGANSRGRYAVHFHRTGIDSHIAPVRVKGCAVMNSPGWGFVNHSSQVEFDENVAYNVDGSAFVTEAGDEIGAFRRNLAVHSVGSGEDVFSRGGLQDFGHEGDGFWFQGGGVTVEDNIAAGQASSGFLYFTLGLDQEGLGRTGFLAANLPDRAWARGHDRVSIGEVPLRSFKGNTAYASKFGYSVRYQLSAGPMPKYGGPQNPAGRSVLEGGVIWNTTYGVRLQYSHKITLRNLRLIGSPEGRNSLCGVLAANEGMKSLRYEDLRVEGWEVGINVKECADHVIAGGYFNNRHNLYIPTPIAHDRTVDIEGDIQFGNLSAKDLRGEPQYDIYLASGPKEFRELLQGDFKGRNPNLLFAPSVTLIHSGPYQGMQLYYLEQAADYVPFTEEARGSVPAELIGKSNREMWDRYGLAIGGAVAPADARRDPRIHGLIGKPAKYLPELHTPNVSTKQLRRVTVAWTDDHKNVIASKITDLVRGWNLVTLRVGNHPRSQLVFAGESNRSTKTFKPYDAPVKK